MIKLSLVKKFGVELVKGDAIECQHDSKCEEVITTLQSVHFNHGIAGDNRNITSFTPRLISDGIPDSIDGDVLLEITNGNGLVLYISARNVAWHEWKTWRPSMEWLVQQASDKSVAYKDDTQHFGEDVQVDLHNVTYVPEVLVSGHTVKKPIFTQAMADAGELPPVGSNFRTDGDDGYCYLRCVANHVDGGVIGQDDSARMFWVMAGAMALDTRTEKQKAVDEFGSDIDDVWQGKTETELAEALYDIGYRKLTQEQKSVDQIVTDIGMDDEMLTYPSTVITKMIDAGLLK